ncbi:MAG: carbonic anhydrase [Bacteroidota bacterium]|nr:carbonic anhydrase [Bacteroidota bacterium]
MGLTYKQVFENNRLWVAEKRASDRDFFTKLSRDQHPDYLYIGCSDSRVPAEIFMGAQPGDVFVHRNIANQVALSDHNATGVIHFAVDQLGVKHIVVCGHYMCGGVKAAMEASKNSPLDPWFDQVREVAELNRHELETINDVGERFRRLVELNVEAQCRNLLKLKVVQESIRKNGIPALHAWVFDIHSGKLIDLDFQYDRASI